MNRLNIFVYTFLTIFVIGILATIGHTIYYNTKEKFENDSGTVVFDNSGTIEYSNRIKQLNKNIQQDKKNHMIDNDFLHGQYDNLTNKYIQDV